MPLFKLTQLTSFKLWNEIQGETLTLDIHDTTLSKSHLLLPWFLTHHLHDV